MRLAIKTCVKGFGKNITEAFTKQINKLEKQNGEFTFQLIFSLTRCSLTGREACRRKFLFSCSWVSRKWEPSGSYGLLHTDWNDLSRLMPCYFSPVGREHVTINATNAKDPRSWKGQPVLNQTPMIKTTILPDLDPKRRK